MSKFIFLLVILPFFVQSLSVNRLSDALSFNNIFFDHREFGFTPAPPPHTEEAKLARYVVHYSGKLVNFMCSSHVFTNPEFLLQNFPCFVFPTR